MAVVTDCLAFLPAPAPCPRRRKPWAPACVQGCSGLAGPLTTGGAGWECWARAQAHAMAWHGCGRPFPLRVPGDWWLQPPEREGERDGPGRMGRGVRARAGEPGAVVPFTLIVTKAVTTRGPRATWGSCSRGRRLARGLARGRAHGGPALGGLRCAGLSELPSPPGGAPVSPQPPTAGGLGLQRRD